MPNPSLLRSSVAALAVLAAADLRDLWRQVNTADQARDALADVLPLLVRSYGAASATVAADWYDDLRDELNVAGRFSAIVPDLDTRGADELARWGVDPLFRPEPDWAAARTLVEGGLQRRIANAARDTVRVSSVEDPKARGWQRVTSAACAFCRMLAGRGAVYTEASADFASHDHCNCHAVPAFAGRPQLVQPSTPDVPDADRARVREFLATHNAG